MKKIYAFLFTLLIASSLKAGYRPNALTGRMDRVDSSTAAAGFANPATANLNMNDIYDIIEARKIIGPAANSQYANVVLSARSNLTTGMLDYMSVGPVGALGRQRILIGTGIYLDFAFDTDVTSMQPITGVGAGMTMHATVANGLDYGFGIIGGVETNKREFLYFEGFDGSNTVGNKLFWDPNSGSAYFGFERRLSMQGNSLYDIGTASSNFDTAGGLTVKSTFTVTKSTLVLNGTTYYWNAGAGTSGQFLKTDGAATPSLTWGTASAGASALAIGTGTAANYVTTVTSPTSNISLLSGQFLVTTNGTTNFIAINPSSGTLAGNSFGAANQLLKLDSTGGLGTVVSATFTAVVVATVTNTLGIAGYTVTLTNPLPNDLLIIQSTTTKTMVNTPAYTVYWREKEFSDPVNVSTNTSFYTTTSTNPYYGKVRFTANSSSNTTYVEYSAIVPTYISTNTDPVANFEIRLGSATDTGSHKFFIEMASLANSASFDTVTYSNAISLTIAGDASGASGDREAVTGVTLTGWGAALTGAGRGWKIRLKNDPSGTSTIDPYATNLLIDVPLTRP